ncbi:MAG: NAD(P)-dependent oxidoreductase [Litorilinea sp.]|nr:MAG: NAD(P)-dependent oxidoreductase [Litorilinea sp.]
MHILIVGGRGQLGRAFHAVLAGQAGHTVTVWQRPEHDITRPQVAQEVAALAPDLVINVAAWTHVDGAEAEPDAAYAANALGPAYLAEGCERCGATLVQISTNEVFAGEPGRFYREYDLPAPASVYARSKHAGEVAASRLLRRLYIVRVAWLFGPGGNNFPTKIAAAADRAAREGGTLRLVADEFGNPTYAPDVAQATMQLVESGHYGIYHLVNEGCASRLEFARAVLEGSGRGQVPFTPISAEEWPRPAPPPRHAVLVNQAAAALGIRLRPWQEALAAYLQVEPNLQPRSTREATP